MEFTRNEGVDMKEDDEYTNNIFTEIRNLTNQLQQKIQQANERIELQNKNFEAKFPIIRNFEEKIKLNVGGKKFETLLSTLRRYPYSMLGAMFKYR